MPDASPVEPGAVSDPRKKRYWFPIGVIVVAVLAVIGLETIENAEALSPVASRLAKFLTPFLARVIVIGVSLIALALWFLFFSPLPRRTRFGAAVAVVAAFVAFRAAFKIEGFTGDIVPRVRARWLAAPELPQASDAKTDLTAVSADDFPEFLGPGRRATLATTDLAQDWSAQPPKLLWRQPIGAAWSSFAVVGPYAVTQEQRGEDGNQEPVTCYEVANGKLRWEYSTPGRFSAALAGVGPRATPTIHEGKVYALGALGHLVCLDGETGKLIWQHDIVDENGANCRSGAKAARRWSMKAW